MLESRLNLARILVIQAGNHKHLTKDGMSCFMDLLQIFCSAWAQSPENGMIDVEFISFS
jgi:hypothetical protein